MIFKVSLRFETLMGSCLFGLVTDEAPEFDCVLVVETLGISAEDLGWFKTEAKLETHVIDSRN